MYRFLLTLLALIAFAGAPACAQQRPETQAGQPQLDLPTDTLTVHTAGGPVRFRVQVAAEDATRQKGLMFRRAMPDDEGMLFDFQFDQPVAFWMRNTFIPLDMLFVRADGRILSIARNARPFDESQIPSGGPVRYVVEINAGLADRLGIRPGDRVVGERTLRPG